MKSKAVEEARDHILFYFKNLLRTSDQMNTPPGYLPAERLRKRLEAGVFQSSEITWEALTSVYRTVLGTPDQVAERIAFWCEQAQGPTHGRPMAGMNLEEKEDLARSWICGRHAGCRSFWWSMICRSSWIWPTGSSCSISGHQDRAAAGHQDGRRLLRRRPLRAPTYLDVTSGHSLPDSRTAIRAKPDVRALKFEA
jgi:hypothetical protein